MIKTRPYNDDDLRFFPVYPVTVDINYKQEKISCSMGRNIHQIFLVSGGAGILGINNMVFALHEGDMFFLPAAVPHFYEGDGDSFTTSYLGFCGRDSELIFEYYGVSGASVFHGCNYTPFLNEISELYTNFENIRESTQMAARAYSAVLSFFDEALKKERSPIQHVFDYLEANYQKPVMMQDILSIYPYSKSKLCRDFKAEYGMSVFEALTKIRLDHAGFMLAKNPYIKLRDVCEACGFNDESYFCRMYKREYGKSPRA